MKFSAQEEYGLRCLLQIARRGEVESMTIPEISRVEGLSATHVAKLLMILRKDGFITSTRGQSGGYALARPSNQIRIDEVLASLGGKLYDDGFCNRHKGSGDLCTHAVDCSVRSLWQVIQSSVDDALRTMTVADMIAPKPVSNVQLFDTPRRLMETI